MPFLAKVLRDGVAALVMIDGDLRKLGLELHDFRVFGTSNDDKLYCLLIKVFFDATFSKSSRLLLF